jgi:radical SAM superfamily enzyme YgiQ (UPF0313 family)
VKEFDTVFMHPPRTLSGSQVFVQFPIVPMGLFSLASILESNGSETKIVNLCLENSEDIRRIIRTTQSKIYCIDLHWFVHSNGALEIAKMCKQYHPNSFVVLGGLTATWFHEEILSNYPDVDAIVLGEAEEPLLSFAKSVESQRKITGLRGVASRDGSLAKGQAETVLPSSLDELNFTQLSLMDDWKKYVRCDLEGYHSNAPTYFWLTIARGCLFDCIHCGGSRSSYGSLTGRYLPTFRSPKKIADDLRNLYDQGIFTVNFNSDPEMGGRKYCLELLSEVEKTGVDMSIYWESFRLPSKAFLEGTAKVFYSSRVAISAESPSEATRMRIGRPFSNDELFRAIEACENLGINADVYFTVGLPGDDHSFLGTFKKMTERICKGLFTGVVPLTNYMLDPNCQLAVSPERYEARTYAKTLEDYRSVFRSNDDRDWVLHETTALSRQDILRIIAEGNYHLAKMPPPLMRPEWQDMRERLF